MSFRYSVSLEGLKNPEGTGTKSKWQLLVFCPLGPCHDFLLYRPEHDYDTDYYGGVTPIEDWILVLD